MKRLASLAFVALAAASVAVAQPSAEKILSKIEFRSIGPAVTGGRVVDVEAHPAQPNTIYVAAASGGLWKSTNNGTTWTPIFDHQETVSIGDVAIAPSNPDIVWVGTGEHNNQRSCHFGDGVYKSTDGGKTWTNMGLKDSIHIGRIAIHPTNPDIVLVASSGPLYRPGGDRGVYRSTDGGKTWSLVLKGDNDTTGFIDIAINPKNPKEVYAAAYDRLRRAWHIRDAGPGSAIYKSEDGGTTWKKLTNGLPESKQLGRIGIAIFPENPSIVYAIIENQNQGETSGVYRTNDAGKTWTRTSDRAVPASYYYSQIRVDPKNPEILYVFNVQLLFSNDGGKSFRRLDSQVHVDHHALWIDPNNPERLLLGNDGGFYMSYDRGATWRFINNLPIPQFYAIGADMSVPYNVFGGLQDNGVWHGPSRTRKPSGIDNSDWKNILGGDGFYAIADPEDPATIYTSSQFGGTARVDMRTRTSTPIAPREQGLRRNWMTPFLISPHNAKILYWGAQKLFRSLDRGDTWQAISGDLTTNDPEKIRGNVPHCTITTIDESPVQAGVIWVGTDDGNVWFTPDGGHTWKQVNQNLPGAPKNWWVSRVVASPHDVNTAFVTITGFREDDFTPYIYKTTDMGETWTSLVANLKNEQVSVIRQDALNPDLLIVGTERACYVSLDGGGSWVRLTNGIPTTPCQDLLIHPRDGDLIVGTHGRGVFIADINPLRQLTRDVMQQDAYLFQPQTALAHDFIADMFDAFNGHARYTAPNPAFGATIWYYLKSEQQGVKIEILDVTGRVLRELDGTGDAGLNKVVWPLNRQGSRGLVPAGTYGVRLRIGDRTLTTTLTVVDWER
jgi:photosystem II stability/assembly factor-like uncharacterized protein